MFRGKTLEEVQAMPNYPFYISPTSVIKAELTPTQSWVLDQGYVTNGALASKVDHKPGGTAPEVTNI